MKTKHAIVIDINGYKVEFILVEEQDDGKINPLYYALIEGYSLVYDEIPTALSMINPHWTGSTWEETATPKQIESAKPEPSPPSPPSDTELLVAEITTLLTIMQEQNDMAMADLTMLMATGMEVK